MASAEPFETYLNAERKAKNQVRKEREAARQVDIKKRFGSLVPERRDFQPQLQGIRKQTKEGKLTPEQSARARQSILDMRKEDRLDQKDSIRKAKETIRMGREDGLSRKFMISDSPNRPYVSGF